MKLWDFKANIYDRMRSVFPFGFVRQQEHRNITQLLADVPLVNARVLDVGTGTGDILPLIKGGSEIIAADASFKMLRQARKKQIGKLVVADCMNLAFRSRSFDVVTTIGLVEYQNDVTTLLFELARVTRPGGAVVMTFSQKRMFNRLRNLLGHRLSLFSMDEFLKLLNTTNLRVKKSHRSFIQYQIYCRKLYV